VPCFDPGHGLAQPGPCHLRPLDIEARGMNRKSSSNLTRRSFFQRSGTAFGLASLAAFSPGSTLFASEAWPPARHSLIHDGNVVLFQGDSITDAGRSREKAGTPNEQPGWEMVMSGSLAPNSWLTVRRAI
jgi:hypothetical protein